AGTKKQILLRPEHLHIEPNGNGNAVIEKMTFQGAMLEIIVQHLG
ncbi:MAG TPA: TOBE domain-containing protein, partial [Psychromonas hadalis]|nr:TOBE domain-containing protein [Psychromonas hadalis]